MLKLMKYLKPHVWSIMLITGMLFIQAISDLSLPEYMSDIVNIGIQQKGVENAVPEAIRKTELDKLQLFLTEKEVQKVYSSYELLERSELSKEDYEKYNEKYPKLEQEPIYRLKTKNEDKIQSLNKILGKAMLITSGIKKNGLTSPANLPKAQLKEILKGANKQIDEMPDSIVTQTAVSFVAKEYKSLGVDMDKLQRNYIFKSGAMMLGIALVSMAAAVSVAFMGSRVATGLSRTLRKNVFRKIGSFSNIEFDKFSTSSLITRTTNDIQQIQQIMAMLFSILFYAPILGVGGVIKVLNTDANMGWIILVAIGAILIIVLFLFGLGFPKFKILQKLVDRLNLVTRENLTGMLVIRAFNTQKNEEGKFEEVNKEFTRTNLFINRLMALMMPSIMLTMNCITILIVWVGAHQVDLGTIQVGDMMAFIQYTMQIVMAFVMISIVSTQLPRASVSAQRITEVLNTEPTIHDPILPIEFHDDKKGVVEFKKVYFQYPGAKDYVLQNITFTARPGQTTAIIGSTGSGKSTLINLIPRFYDVTDGEVLVDGVNIRNVSQHSLREKIGYVPQKGMLFSGTIESNLKYGKEHATEEDLKRASEISQAKEFIFNNAEGFQSEISQGGSNVSGGQKQRLSIARAVIKHPEILIFDDSFSALDYRTDRALRAALKLETEESTVIIVAQRISTIMSADQIIVLDEGKIEGIGTHKELMSTCKVYQEIALSQLSEEELSS